MSAPLVDRLARWARGVRADTLTPQTVATAKALVLDSLGCALAGHGSEAAQQVLRAVASLGGEKQATILGTNDRSAVTAAVLANGALIRALDFNDFYWGPRLGGHPSDNLAVAIALAEARGRGGAALLAAMVAGYEICCRVQDLMDPGKPWDHVSASGLAAAAIAAHLIGLDERRFAEALAIAGTQSVALGALRQGRIAEAKAVANARVAQDATLAVLLAEQGMTGPREALDGPSGLSAILHAEASLDNLIPAPGERPRLLDVAIKAYPCIGTAQTAIACALELRRRLPDAAGRLSRIDLHVADAPVVRQQGSPIYRRPDGHETADHSFYFLVAVALADGEVTTAQFEGERWRDPTLHSLMDRITLHPDHPAIDGSKFPARLEATTADGARLTIETPFAPGHPRNPLSHEAVADKFRGCARGLISEQRCATVIDLIGRLEQLPSIAPVIAALGSDTASVRGRRRAI